MDAWRMGGTKTATDGSFDLPDFDFSNVSVSCFTPNEESAPIIYDFKDFLRNPSSYGVPVFMLQIILMTITSRIIYRVFRPIKQPRIVVMGKVWSKYGSLMFPSHELAVCRTLAAIGLMFHLFLLGVRTDPRMILQAGRKAFLIGIFSTAVPFSVVATAAFLLRDSIGASIAHGGFLAFLAASLSISSFPVVADIVAELGLLNSEIGRLAVSISMVHGISIWFFVALFIALNHFRAGLDKATGALVSVMVLIGIVVFVFRPWMLRIVKRTPKGGKVSGSQMRGIVLSVVLMGLLSELMGASFADGTLIMGLVVPHGPPLGSDLVQRIGGMANEVLMPLLFITGGERSAPFETFKFWRKWRPLTVLLLLTYVSKMTATVTPAMYCGIPLRNAFVLGLMMNFQGLIEFITFINFRNGSLLDDQSFTVLVLGIVAITMVASALVKLLYRPSGRDSAVCRGGIEGLRPSSELRMLACLSGEEQIPATMALLEASGAGENSPVCVYVLHLVELAGRADSAMIAHRNKKGEIDPDGMDRLHNVFVQYERGREGAVAVQPFTAVAPFKTMHQDICFLAGEKGVAIILLPFLSKDASGELAASDHAFRSNVAHVLSKAPCSVGLLLHIGQTVTTLSTPAKFQHHIGLLFWGGPDDREALSYAARMVRQTGVTLTVTRFLSPNSPVRNEREAQIDTKLIEDFREENSSNERALINEVCVDGTEQTIAIIRKFCCMGYSLILVGRRLSWNSMVNCELEEWSEFPELGVVGDMIVSSDPEFEFFVLIVQQMA